MSQPLVLRHMLWASLALGRMILHPILTPGSGHRKPVFEKSVKGTIAMGMRVNKKPRIVANALSSTSNIVSKGRGHESVHRNILNVVRVSPWSVGGGGVTENSDSP